MTVTSVKEKASHKNKLVSVMNQYGDALDDEQEGLHDEENHFVFAGMNYTTQELGVGRHATVCLSQKKQKRTAQQETTAAEKPVLNMFVIDRHAEWMRRQGTEQNQLSEAERHLSTSQHGGVWDAFLSPTSRCILTTSPPLCEIHHMHTVRQSASASAMTLQFTNGSSDASSSASQRLTAGGVLLMIERVVVRDAKRSSPSPSPAPSGRDTSVYDTIMCGKETDDISPDDIASLFGKTNTIAETSTFDGGFGRQDDRHEHFVFDNEDTTPLTDMAGQAVNLSASPLAPHDSQIAMSSPLVSCHPLDSVAFKRHLSGLLPVYMLSATAGQLLAACTARRQWIENLQHRQKVQNGNQLDRKTPADEHSEHNAVDYHELITRLTAVIVNLQHQHAYHHYHTHTQQQHQEQALSLGRAHNGIASQSGVLPTPSFVEQFDLARIAVDDAGDDPNTAEMIREETIAKHRDLGASHSYHLTQQLLLRESVHSCVTVILSTCKQMREDQRLLSTQSIEGDAASPHCFFIYSNVWVDSYVRDVTQTIQFLKEEEVRGKGESSSTASLDLIRQLSQQPSKAALSQYQRLRHNSLP